MKTQVDFNIIVLIVVTIVVFVGSAGLYIAQKNRDGGNNYGCTMDAMLCPDGSYVGRTGPKCEFHCPSVALCEGGVCPTPTTITGTILLERHSSWGPCPSEESKCYMDDTLYSSGKIIISGNVNLESTLTSTEVQRIIGQIQSSGIMTKNCSRSYVVDSYVSYIIYFDGKKKTIDGYGSCENDLLPIERIVGKYTR